jgi:ABC-2 type transport system ATP-binding protein
MVIEANNLSKTFYYYKKELGLKSSIQNIFKREKLLKEAVKYISLQIDEGEIVGFLGPNGAGKTTTLKMLSGILFPTNGVARVAGYIPWERKKSFKMQFSIVMGQKSQLWWDLPAIESLNLNKYIYEISDKDFKTSVEELSVLLDVKDLLNVQVRRLSLGERMKLELIAALIHKPKILFLDEPTIGLDIISQRKLRDFIKNYNQQTKTTIVLTSHYMNDIEELCKRVLIINEGKIVYDGNLNKINQLFIQRKFLKLHFSDYTEKSLLSKYGFVKSFDGYSATIEVNKNNIKEYSKDILESFPIADFTVEDVPIEECISILYKRGTCINEETT